MNIWIIHSPCSCIHLLIDMHLLPRATNVLPPPLYLILPSRITCLKYKLTPFFIHKTCWVTYIGSFLSPAICRAGLRIREFLSESRKQAKCSHMYNTTSDLDWIFENLIVFRDKLSSSLLWLYAPLVLWIETVKCLCSITRHMF